MSSLPGPNIVRTASRRRPVASLSRGAAAGVVGACLALTMSAAAAQSGLRLRIEPTLSAGLSTINNYRSDPGARQRSAVVPTVSPGVRMRLESRGGRVQGSVDYGLSTVVNLRDIEDTALRNRLSARARAEVIENHFDVNVFGSISRQPISIFGRQTVDGSPIDENQSEVRNLSVQPVLRGVLAGEVAVQASATARYSDAAARGYTEDGRSASLSLSSARPARVGWSLVGTRSVSEFEGGRETTIDRVTGSVSLRPDVDWLFTLRAGQERTDIASVQQRTYDNWGAGVVWTPNPRTSVAVDGDHRFFGTSYAVSVQHRHRRIVWRYAGSRGVGESVGQGAIAVRAYDLFFDLFASQEPDPILRDLLVRDFLDRNGIPPEAIVGGLGFLTRAASLQERHQVSMGVNLRRATVTTSLYVSRSERIDTISGAIDDLFEGAVRQQGLSVALGYRVTPRDSVNLTATATRTRPSGDRDDSSLYSLALGWSTRVSERIGFSVGLRHSAYDRESADDYTDTSITTALRLSFY
jgi:uncharacterized protein (PEP-CTERM system associated)